MSSRNLQETPDLAEVGEQLLEASLSGNENGGGHVRHDSSQIPVSSTTPNPAPAPTTSVTTEIPSPVQCALPAGDSREEEPLSAPLGQLTIPSGQSSCGNDSEETAEDTVKVSSGISSTDRKSEEQVKPLEVPEKLKEISCTAPEKKEVIFGSAFTGFSGMGHGSDRSPFAGVTSNGFQRRTGDAGAETIEDVAKQQKLFGQAGLGGSVKEIPESSCATPSFGSFGLGSHGFGGGLTNSFGFNGFAGVVSESKTSETPDGDSSQGTEKKQPVFGSAFGGFGTALATVKVNGFDKKIDENSVETLKEAANREYEAKQQKPMFQEVDVVTGEESERNVFEINVKLHVFDKETKQWKERGRAIARLNDAHDKSYSRLVIRMVGTLRIIINTNVWKDMMVERLSDKNVTFSAFDTTDDNALKVFLISCSVENADTIFRELKARRERIKSLKPSSPPATSKKVSPSPSLDSPSSESDQPVKKAKIAESS